MSTNPHDLSNPNRQGQYPPPQWNTSQPEDNPPAHYPPASQYPYPPASYPPPSADHQYPHPPPQYPNMAAIHPHVQGPQDPYRLPPPPSGPYRPDVYAQPPPPQPQVVYQAAAPRQRTAIACRYCRRRKIRCSGFESSQDGRCSNCIRFNQECMFTPVSSQAQAFVPAHAAYPHLRNPQNQRAGGPPVMLYGAHGQPLPPQQQPQADPTLPPPQGMYNYPGAAPPLASTNAPEHRPGGRRGSGSGYDYPDPTNLAPVIPSTSASGYQTHNAPSPYYPPPQHDRRSSPQSYPYDGRHTSSPHGSPYPPMHSAQGAMTPPPTSTPGGSTRGGLNVRDMLNPGDSQGRSSTDSDMLNALNRRGLNQ
ncbi:hypothetical protein ASPACDRAFT_40863 [Aspergillus aculeatus ATCC 16872]|uniref:Zn(2)-C6 fungal-type domain-containing protein n=1 Tax=Aspergillus aculeatus (strain ATCC 16872 / CBS 172.66 / WB 5094) TaxID=690307 RepID=A0A1L9X0M9_ASPA1|nr:uncharacterized protein ASPACDRAFT_40863 [Aspergillus aculeatus ATCC 16872]OJK02040.1 hypothetical protein ASPACDRAFT_40863 [Aspergillus aculeatus ATCC 16872]